jgi:hypothetical protein
MSQQRCSELEDKLQQLQQQHRLSMQTNPANMIEAARGQAIADLEQVGHHDFADVLSWFIQFYCLILDVRCDCCCRC